VGHASELLQLRPYSQAVDGLYGGIGQVRPLCQITRIGGKEHVEAVRTPAKPFAAFFSVKWFEPLKVDAVRNNLHLGRDYIVWQRIS
jgi:hypothetical protein